MISDELRERRLATLDVHFRSEVDHDWDACLAIACRHTSLRDRAARSRTEGDEEVLAYHRAQRQAFPTSGTRTPASTSPTTTR
ncbi:MAG: hypothetical protein R2697_00765 [Ilumatobacteraceae bacterium]